MRLYFRRREEEKIRGINSWTLIYGRRKTGKTTLIKNNLKMDFYALIADSNNAIDLNDNIMKIDDVIKEVKSTLSKGGTAVIDEFQRLPEVFWSMISNWKREGVLVLVASSYGIVNKVFDRNSPLLGLFLPMDNIL
ncbi:AAA family ATPase [Stygiolobus caldivivus]|uniref:AAA domain-containing protein n=1 Tax=Stygiolobus caldivivus TaxID=2824673 RepID=A0A8D5U3U5_9CREN|nr:AAA family ATPase [Stygiolobus caldivivus]BCU68742.1 hypothetical protein KN1_00390 [Stygiolobus caldivivus]